MGLIESMSNFVGGGKRRRRRSRKGMRWRRVVAFARRLADGCGDREEQGDVGGCGGQLR